MVEWSVFDASIRRFLALASHRTDEFLDINMPSTVLRRGGFTSGDDHFTTITRIARMFESTSIRDMCRT